MVTTFLVFQALIWKASLLHRKEAARLLDLTVYQVLQHEHESDRARLHRCIYNDDSRGVSIQYMQNMFPCFYFSIIYRFVLLSKLFHLKKAARKSPQRQWHSPPSRAEVPPTATLTAACDSFSQALPVIGKRTSTHPNEDGNISNNSKGSVQRFYNKRIGTKNPIEGARNC